MCGKIYATVVLKLYFAFTFVQISCCNAILTLRSIYLEANLRNTVLRNSQQLRAGLENPGHQ